MNAIKSTYRIIYILLGLIGIAIQLGFFQKTFYPSSLVYYTNLSNILCVIYFTLRFIYDNTNIRDREFKTFILSGNTKFAITMSIAMTSLIYHFLLSDTMSQILSVNDFGNYIVHYIIPLMTIIDFLCFDKKEENIRWYTPIIWLIIPSAYLIFISVRAPLLGNIGQTSSPFPYPFIDLTIQPALCVLINIIVITVVFIALGYLLLLINALIQKLIFKE